MPGKDERAQGLEGTSNHYDQLDEVDEALMNSALDEPDELNEEVDPVLALQQQEKLSENDISIEMLQNALESSGTGIDKEVRELQKQASSMHRSYSEMRMMVRKQVRSLYDAQLLRIQTAGRINRASGDPTQLEEIDMAIMKLRAKQLDRWECSVERDLLIILRKVPAYTEIMARRPDYWGIGTRMAGVILSEFDIYRQDTCSKMWSFAGLAPEPALLCKICKVTIPCDLSEAWKAKLKEDHKVKIAELRKTMIANSVIAIARETKDPKKRKTKEAVERKRINELIANKKKPVYKAPPHDLLLPRKHPRTKCEMAGKNMTLGDVVEGKKGARPVKDYLLHYNAWLRTKLLGALAPVLIKGAAKCPLRLKYYDVYKARKAAAGWGQSMGHRHAAAMRYMIKMTLADIHREWRTLEGLPVRPTYQEEYLGHVSSRA